MSTTPRLQAGKRYRRAERPRAVLAIFQPYCTIADDTSATGSNLMKTAQVRDVIAIMEEIAPPAFALEGDSIGLQVGNRLGKVRNVLLCLDVTTAVLQEAQSLGIDLVIAHHPLVFRPLSRLVITTYPGTLIAQAVRSDISVYAAHSNLDLAPGGVNDVLVDILTAELGDYTREPLLCREGSTTIGLGRVIRLCSPVDWHTIIHIIETGLSPQFIRLAGEPISHVTSIAICGGSGNGLVETVIEQEAELFITGELKYHDALQAKILGLTTLEAGHYHTEVPVLAPLQDRLKRETQAQGYDVQVAVTSQITCPYTR